MAACNLLRRQPRREAISAARPLVGASRSWLMFGLLSIPYTFAHIDSRALDHLISPADVLPTLTD
jgi:hypothetical protein